MIRIQGNALHGAYLPALWLVVVPDALGAFVRIDPVDFRSLRDSVVGTRRLAYVAVDALVRDDQSHLLIPAPVSPSCGVSLPGSRTETRHRRVKRFRAPWWQR